MKTSIIKSIGIFAFLAAVVSSCTCPPEYRYITTKYSGDETAHLYAFETSRGLGTAGDQTLKEFKYNKPVVDFMDKIQYPSDTIGEAHTFEEGFGIAHLRTYVYEIRYKNEWTNLASINKGEATLTTLRDFPFQIICDKKTVNGYEYYAVVDTNKVTSPPTYAHLCYNSIDETVNSFMTDIPPLIYKQWEFVELTDDAGGNLMNHADWECYSDDEFGFTKSGQVKFWPGFNRCGMEASLSEQSYFFSFDAVAEFPTVKSSPGEIKVMLYTGGYEELNDFEFTIESSDFDEISGTLVHPETGEVANFVIQPI